MLTITGVVCDCPDGAALCVRSVREQTHREWQHHLWCIGEETIAAARWAAGGDERVHIVEELPSVETFDVLLPFWRSLPAERPVVWLDGDDWLAVPRALSVVDAAHESGAWVTWGSFITETGAMGCAGPVGDDVRHEPWRASHLKTFRAGLVQRIRPADFLDSQGRTHRLAKDWAVMFAAIEMTPEARRLYIERVLLVYNFGHSWEWQRSADQKRVEELEAARIRRFEPYAPLVSLA
jgi:hypothetical protein